ncbi:MAG: sensor histidine kinase [Rehaibacterium terrae]|uniref:sensor histidine kinase n=1 Tax=Rehaibacterium terrae TaxID=1341696 RepID=UPI00391982D5
MAERRYRSNDVGNGGDHSGESALRRELYFFTLYRILEAGILAFLAFSPFGAAFTELRHPLLAQTAAVVYLLLSSALLLAGRVPRFDLRRQVMAGLGLDLVAAAIALNSLTGLEAGVSLLLLFNIGAGALLLPLRAGLGFAVAAAAMVMGEYVLSGFQQTNARPAAEPVMFAVTYLATAIFTHLLGRQMRATQELAEQRGAEVANLAEINELIIRRMRTGLLVVDGDNQVRLFNEAAWHLLGSPSPDKRRLGDIAPELSRRLWHWQHDKPVSMEPVALAEDVPEVIPRFTRLSASEDLVLIFLEDTTLYSRRAEELTLTTLGRLSASIAHEIRNPLAAISYAAQLLEECESLPEPDRRLVEIINAQCQRMNGIIQNVLSIARRERAQPEALDLPPWLRRFADDYRISHPLENDEIAVVCAQPRIHAMVDPSHLQQVLTILVHNALTYGRLPGEAARVTLAVRADERGVPIVEVIDRGPGIPPKVAEAIFDPFFTTNPHGTGLGLYIARQLCEANQAILSHHGVPGGGSCFRITLPRVHVLAGGLDKA